MEDRQKAALPVLSRDGFETEQEWRTSITDRIRSGNLSSKTVVFIPSNPPETQYIFVRDLISGAY